MNKKSLKFIILVIVILAGVLFYNHFFGNRNENDSKLAQNIKEYVAEDSSAKAATTSDHQQNTIDELTDESVVVPYVKEHGKLPPCYITKSEARAQGWDASEGNLCDVLPGRAIGGDRFSNREGNLPEKRGRIWHEADLNYHCGRRNSDRLLYSTDGLVYVTHNHYKTFEKQ